MTEMIGLGPGLLILAVMVTILAGVIKGMVGFAMPLVMVSGLSLILEPKLALAAMIVPVFVVNLIQTFRGGVSAALNAVAEFWRYLLALCLTIVIAAQIVVLVPDRVFYLVLGVPVVIISVIQLIGWRPELAQAWRGQAEIALGVLSGVFGGIAGTWGPLTVMYLMAIGTPRARQMIAQGAIYAAGSVTLLAAHVKSGLLNAESAALSLALVLPGFVGLWIGFRLQDRMNPDTFRMITLIVIIIGGLNLIRRGITG